VGVQVTLVQGGTVYITEEGGGGRCCGVVRSGLLLPFAVGRVSSRVPHALSLSASFLSALALYAVIYL
jgi:hypothetical protein